MQQDRINVAFVGHVDHGKSSILGRLLVETGSLPSGKLEQLTTYCKAHSKDFEYAYLIDALEKEQSQGITIDMARYFIRSGGYKFMFIDTPGHLDLIKNMITGSSTADIGLLIIDAKEGIKENTLRHVFLLSFLQIHRVIVLINKMDRVEYSEETYKTLSESIAEVFKKHRLALAGILPISAKIGDNLTSRSPNTPWYQGKSLWENLCAYTPSKPNQGGSFLMPLQDVYRFSKGGDSRRIYSGTITSGSLKVGDRLLFSPSQKEGVVASIESDPAKAKAGFAIGFTLEEPIFVERGEIVTQIDGSPPKISDQIHCRLFLLNAVAIAPNRKLTLRIHTCKVSCYIEEIHSVYDSATLQMKEREAAKRYDIVECAIRISKPIALDRDRFVLSDSYEMVATGSIE